MWLINSSIGRKLIMSITGICLILFLTFHMLMNLVALISPHAYNLICEFLGANWYALVATMGLAVGFLLHIVYAFYLFYQNKKARGSNKYAESSLPKEVKWASQNMLVLGIVVASFLVLHLYNFWAKMQLVEVLHKLGVDVDPESMRRATDGVDHIAKTFSDPIYVFLYVVGLVALWFHLTHGFWSALQSIGLNNKVWFNRIKTIGNVYSTVIVLGFALVVFVFYIKSLVCI